ncbi:MAG: cellobiose phosphorylase [Bacteroidetes bacterium]|nr:cellobiose phosphorylase [Bacteroidota bacterium]
MKFNNDINSAGGIAARKKTGPLWYFLPENDGTFLSPNAEYISRLYFPLMNRHGMKCSVTPELKGDIASSFQNYLTAATVTEELHRNVSGRNFWVKVAGQAPWSATGNSTFQKAEKWTGNRDESEIEGKIGAFINRRRNKMLGLESEITVFVPDADDFVELMKVTIKNISDTPLSFTPTSATPIFGRHADNFRDHRQVTTMFQKVFIEKHGVRVKPTIVHDEFGHSVNNISYAVLGFEANGKKPVEIWPLMYDFIGEGGTLDNPEVVANDLPAPQYANGEANGQEAIGALRYASITLQPGEESVYIIIHGITDNESDIHTWEQKFGSTAKFDHQLKNTLAYWQEIASAVTISTGDDNFDNWTKWISFQIKCRQIFGNSYLPDFGYGRGGRGWRDLWQDLLAIFLVDPDSAKEEIINCMKGVRVDGSNATIIGTEPGTFIADRNMVPRTWCDHGAWPAFVINFYIQQTGDLDILFHEAPFWKDHFTHRSKKRDDKYAESYGCWQNSESGQVYESSILEHLLIQQLSAFYHVGDHNILLLEGGDWNDTYDMARGKGESIGFYAFYGRNLRIIVDWLSELYERGIKEISLLKEISILLNTNKRSSLYSVASKQQRLTHYFDKVSHHVSGDKIRVGIQTLILDLILKADHISEIIREQEWISIGEGKGFFNGHYDNTGKQVDGQKGDKVMMDLTTQVMTTMNEVATKDDIRSMLNAVDCYLQDGKGYRLCTEFSEVDMNVGRITGFVYGHKEHGSKWMQQNIMLAYGLYLKGFKGKATEIINDAYLLSTNSAVAKIFPGIPSYFGPDDKGAYAYLTGSSTWLLLTLTTQMFGIKGAMGNLSIQPNLSSIHFDRQGKASMKLTFRGIRLYLTYCWGGENISQSYIIDRLTINGKEPALLVKEENNYVIGIDELDAKCDKPVNIIEVSLKSE